MDSLYIWKGKIEEAKEAYLEMKTTTRHAQRAREEIIKLHSYDTPCITQKDLFVNQKCSQWLKNVLQ